MVHKLELPYLELHQIAVKTAQNIHLSDSAEHGRTIDKFGKIKKFVGGIDWVDMSINQDTRIAVHNHPNEYKIPETFSDYDIYHFLSQKQLCEIIVCGYGYYFYLMRGTYRGLSTDITTDITRIRTEIMQKTKKEYLLDDNNDEKTIKVKIREMNIIAENAYHKKLCEYLLGKGLSYGKVKL